MNNPKNIKYSSHLVLTAVLSGGITIAISIIYILMSIAALLFRFFNCEAGIAYNGATFFWKTIFSAYFAESTCEASTELGILRNEITSEYTVFVLTTITLSVSVLCLITAICLITTLQDEESSRCLNFVVFVYIASCIASLVVDLTTASHFGIDYSHLSSVLAVLPPGTDSNYSLEVLRQGAFLLMSISLKGYMVHGINLILMNLLVIYVLEHRKQIKNIETLCRNVDGWFKDLKKKHLTSVHCEHSIHKLGIVSAFDQPRKPNDTNWLTQNDIFPAFPRGSQVNNGFINDEDSTVRTARRDPPRADINHSNRSFEHSDSWQHSQPSLPPSARPFSYLEDPKRPVPTRPPTSPAVEAPWRRDPWPQGPPVPAPDYSPQPARRLKSALKPAYM